MGLLPTLAAHLDERLWPISCTLLVLRLDFVSRKFVFGGFNSSTALQKFPFGRRGWNPKNGRSASPASGLDGPIRNSSGAPNRESEASAIPGQMGFREVPRGCLGNRPIAMTIVQATTTHIQAGKSFTRADGFGRLESLPRKHLGHPGPNLVLMQRVGKNPQAEQQDKRAGNRNVAHQRVRDVPSLVW